MSGHVDASGGSFLQAAVMWQVMMVGMMMPVTAPWLRASFTLVDAHSAYARFHQSAVFAGGYVLVCTVYSVLAAGTQLALRSTHVLGNEGKLQGPLAGAVLIVAASFSSRRSSMRASGTAGIR